MQGETAINGGLRVSIPITYRIFFESEVIAMSYESFKAKVNALIRRSGSGVKVRFSTDEEKGKHFANCSDGTTIIGSPACLKVTVKWGSGHTSMATI